MCLFVFNKMIFDYLFYVGIFWVFLDFWDFIFISCKFIYLFSYGDDYVLFLFIVYFMLN